MRTKAADDAMLNAPVPAPGDVAGDASRPHGGRLVALLLAAACLLMLAVIAVALPAVLRYRDVFPFGDMVDVVWRYFTGPPREFWIYHDNEHLPLFVMPLYWIDLNLFRANGGFLIACNLLLVTLASLAPAPALLRALPRQYILLAAVIATMLAVNLWLGNWINLVWTKQVHMYLSLFGVMMAISVAVSGRPRRLRHAAGIAAWLTLATFSFGYGIVGYPVVLAIGVVRRWPWRVLAAIGLALALCLSIYVTIAAHRLAHNDSYIWMFWSTKFALLYWLTFIASPLVNILRAILPNMAAYQVSWAITVVALAMLCWWALRFLRRPPTELESWAIGLCLFAVAVGAETAVARMVFGYAQSTDGRYVVGQLPFWVGLLLLAAQGFAAAPRLTQAATAGVLVLAGTGLLVSQAGLMPAMRGHAFERWQSAMSAVDSVPDPAVAYQDSMYFQNRVTVEVAGLREHRWSVFGWKQASWIGHSLASFGPPATGCTGAFDTIAPVGQGAGLRAAGWAADPDRAVRAAWLLLVDKDGIVRGLAHGGQPRGDVAAVTHDRGLLYSGWIGYVPATAGETGLSAYLMLGGRHPCRVPGTPAAGA